MRGNWLPPGFEEGRPNEMIYVDTLSRGWSLDVPVPPEEERMYSTIESSLPKSFTQVDAMRHGWPDNDYWVFMENDYCEVVLSREDRYFAVAFLAKEKPEGGWYKNWHQTAKKTFKKLFDAGFELHVWTGEKTSAAWTPDTNDAYIQHLRRKYAETGSVQIAMEFA